MDSRLQKIHQLFYRLTKLSGNSEIGDLAEEGMRLTEAMHAPCKHNHTDYNAKIAQNVCTDCGTVLAEAF